MRDEAAWRVIGELVQRAVDEANASGIPTTTTVGVGEIVANVNASPSGRYVETHMHISFRMPNEAPVADDEEEAPRQAA